MIFIWYKRKQKLRDVKQIAELAGPYLKLYLPACELRHCIQLPHCLLLNISIQLLGRILSLCIKRWSVGTIYQVNSLHMTDSINLPPQPDVTGMVPWRVSYHQVPLWILTVVWCSEGAGSRGHYSGHSLLYYKTTEDPAVPASLFLLQWSYYKHSCSLPKRENQDCEVTLET